MDLTRLRQINEKKQQLLADKTSKHESALLALETQRVIVESVKSLATFLESNVSRTQVVNQLKEIGTPDALKVVEAVNSLDKTLQGKNVDLSEITETMKSVLAQVEQLPKELPQLEIPEQIDNSKQLEDLTKAVECVEKAVKAQKTTVEAPSVTVDAPVVNVSAPDLKPLSSDLEKAFLKAVKGIVFPEQVKTDLSALEKEQKIQTKVLKEIRDKRVSGGGGGGLATPYVNESGIPTFPQLVDGKIPVSLTSSADPSAFYVYDVEDGTTAYYGNTNVAGAWMVKKVTDTLVSYATVTNNVAVTTYTDAWTSRATLSFGRIDEAF